MCQLQAKFCLQTIFENRRTSSSSRGYLQFNQEEHDFFEELQVDGTTNFVGWGGFVWGMVGSGNLCYNWA
jgi:hypothetical protein